MRPISSAIALVFLAPVPALAAQGGPTVPSAVAGIEGGGASLVPFGFDRPVRWQCIYDPEELPWSGPRVINGIAFRADNSQPGTTSFASKQFLAVSLVMSTTTVRAENASPRFDDNLGADATTVIANGRIVLPAQPPTPGVRPANIVFAFDQPWVYGTTPVRSSGVPGSLLLDLRISLQPAGAYRLDGPDNCTSANASFGNRGPRCAGAAGPLQLSAGTNMIAGSSFTYTITGMPARAPFSVVFNITRQGSFLGQPLPYPLFDPANPSQPPTGFPFAFSAPDCWVNVEASNAVAGVADSGGVGSIVVNLPSNRAIVGQSLYAQAVARDLSANQLLLSTSLGLQSTVCGPLGVARIYRVGDHQAQVGQHDLGVAAILEVF